ncbi:MAG: hypothetical protein K6C06_09745 [Lachnospiraceae bacterium]|nr:hypothetical protein [Lachnospiraceae bacterium]
MKKKLSVRSAAAAALMLILISAVPGSGTEPESSSAPEAAEAVTEKDAGNSKVASSSEMTTVEDVVEDWMVPVPAGEIEPGVYEVEVLSSSSMFRIEYALLTVTEDSMSAILSMGGKGYTWLYMGTAEEAAQAPEEDYIPYIETADGTHTFTIPVEALDQGIPAAAFSTRKEKWYDRTLLVSASSLPSGALRNISMTSLEDLSLSDGTYYMNGSLQGGTGKASIESPVMITVRDGEAFARIVMSSSHYDYMLKDGERYDNISAEGNSSFLIPVSGFDYPMPVTADTTAMSRPHEIDYTIILDSSTLTQEPAS